jgi:uncharacterized repeat protein (TIGR03803 family)
MLSHKCSRILLTAFSIALFGWLAVAPVLAAQYKVLDWFSGKNAPAKPLGTLIFDAAGNLYGTTELGGTHENGIVFQLAPDGNGGWVQHVLYNFCSRANCTDGGLPTAGLVFDTSGNLYGTTYGGGSAKQAGVIFRLSPGPGGNWTEKVLYAFCPSRNCTGGSNPFAPLILDSAGNLYGTAFTGGVANRGAAFELVMGANDTWTEKVLYSFCTLSNCSDGANPAAGLVFDPSGNLYGTTLQGGGIGPKGDGAVFELTPGQNGSWTEQVIFSFDNLDGGAPAAGLIFDAKGNLYGTAQVGGHRQDGLVFELSLGAGGAWTESVLHFFHPPNGTPTSGVVLDSEGNLYGTALYGGPDSGGVAFKLSPNQNGAWTQTALHFFNDNGDLPYGGLVLDSLGNLYGTTEGGGPESDGVVYQITP